MIPKSVIDTTKNIRDHYPDFQYRDLFIHDPIVVIAIHWCVK